jgi:tRNA threonylcarbamoyladenosine biosynthesis protein TsaE
LSAVISDGPQATEAAGEALARELRPGDVVLVSGELGAGKSTFVRGACRELGVTEPVVSPTFTIGRRYRGRDLTVAHLDLYRLAGLESEEPGLLDDYLTAGGIAFVEWPERAEDLDLGEGVRVARRVTLRHAGGDLRQIELAGA